MTLLNSNKTLIYFVYELMTDDQLLCHYAYIMTIVCILIEYFTLRTKYYRVVNKLQDLLQDNFNK